MPDQFRDGAEGLAVAAGCLTSWFAGAVAGKLAAVLQAIDDHHGRGRPNKLRRFARLFPGRCRGIRSQKSTLTPLPAAR